MGYTLTELINDKNLCKTLVKNGFIFKDGNDVFTLDFQNQPALKIHRDTFNTLYQLGGDDFMEYLLKKGSTNLTNDPHATQQGVRPILGTENYFLKTNAGKIATVASILNGIFGWAEYAEDFDVDAVMVYTMEEEGIFDTEETDDAMEELFGGPRWEVNGYFTAMWDIFPTYKNCSLATKNGKLCFYDEDSQKFITLYCKKGSELLPLDGMVTCEPLLNAYEEHMGHKYQMTEGGKWGYISKYFAQITEPKFEDIVVATDAWDNNILFAYRNHEEDANFNPFAEEDSENEKEATFDLFYSRVATYSEDSLKDHWFVLAPDFSDVDERFKPNQFTKLDIETDENGNSAILYKAYHAATTALCNIKTDDNWQAEPWAVTYSEPSLYMKNVKTGKTLEYPCTCFDAGACLRALAPMDLDFEMRNIWKISHKDSYVAIICREGYYALAEMELADIPKINKMLTPFAFTAISKLSSDQILLDRFGKKGVYDIHDETYIISCDYEKITRNYNSYSVFRMGFVGEINFYGEWISHLHKEQN